LEWRGGEELAVTEETERQTGTSRPLQGNMVGTIILRIIKAMHQGLFRALKQCVYLTLLSPANAVEVDDWVLYLTRVFKTIVTCAENKWPANKTSDCDDRYDRYGEVVKKLMFAPPSHLEETKKLLLQGRKFAEDCCNQATISFINATHLVQMSENVSRAFNACAKANFKGKKECIAQHERQLLQYKKEQSTTKKECRITEIMKFAAECCEGARNVTQGEKNGFAIYKVKTEIDNCEKSNWKGNRKPEECKTKWAMQQKQREEFLKHKKERMAMAQKFAKECCEPAVGLLLQAEKKVKQCRESITN